EEGAVRLWRLAPGARRLTVSHPTWARSVAFTPDGRHLLVGNAGAEGSEVARWEVATGRRAAPTLRHTNGLGWAEGVAVSPDGRTVLTGSHDRTTRLWDAATGLPLGPPHEHAAEVWAVAVHPDGKTALTGGSDRNAQRWDLATWSPLGPPLPHDGEVNG